MTSNPDEAQIGKHPYLCGYRAAQGRDRHKQLSPRIGSSTYTRVVQGVAAATTGRKPSRRWCPAAHRRVRKPCLCTACLLVDKSAEGATQWWEWWWWRRIASRWRGRQGRRRWASGVVRIISRRAVATPRQGCTARDEHHREVPAPHVYACDGEGLMCVVVSVAPCLPPHKDRVKIMWVLCCGVW